MEDLKTVFNRYARAIVGLTMLLLLVLIAFVGALAAGQIKSYRFIGQGLQMNNTITVQGTAFVEAVPDTAEFTFGVEATGATADAAQKKGTAIMNPIIDKLKSMGVDEKDIQTSGFQIYPQYEYRTQACPIQTMAPQAAGAPTMAGGSSGSAGANVAAPAIYCPPNGHQVLTGYQESNTVTVKVRDLTKTGDIVAAVTGLGATNVSGVNFIVEDQDAKMEQARRMAIADARQKADVLASDLGVHIVSIVSFNDSGMAYPVMYGAMAKSADSAGIAPAPAPDIEQGQNKITSNVSIVYAID